MDSTSTPHTPKKGSGAIGLIAYAVGVGVVLFATWLTPLSQAPVAVLVAPGSTSAFKVVEASGGHMLSISALPNIVIARSDHPEFVSNLYAHGALFVFNPQFLTSCQSKA
jgi:hypothetical protein